MPDDEKSPLDRLADLVVFGPLGLALDARDLWPDFVRRGRQELGATRGRGGDVVGRGRSWASDRVDDVQSQTGSALRGLGLGSNGSPPATKPQATGSRRTTPPKPSRPEPQDGPPVDTEDLAVPDYDSLSASQVVPRLAGLSGDELEQVRRYEAGTRGRKTILNKIAQLQST